MKKCENCRYCYTSAGCYTCKRELNGEPSNWQPVTMVTELRKAMLNNYYSHPSRRKALYRIKNVIFNGPATIVLWNDGTKTVVKCGKNDTFDPEKGLAMAISKYFFDNAGYFNDVFKKWIPKKGESNEKDQ